MSELDLINGKIQIDSSICSKGFAYISQESWLEAMTIKENILFGNEMNTSYYKQCIDACDLNRDLEMFANGDMMMVGENGICLSGGQKARIALCRACYAGKDKDVYLLDDPLSAVDQNVAKNIYDKCISQLLASKTRILATHHIKYLTNADLILKPPRNFASEMIRSQQPASSSANQSSICKSIKQTNWMQCFQMI